MVPTWDEFRTDYLPHYFDDSEPYAGRCFIIVAGGQDVGVVCYNAIDEQRRHTELDIRLWSEVDCDKAYGSNALRLLCQRLHEAYEVLEFIMRPSRRNRRAIAANEKAGFERLPPNWQPEIHRGFHLRHCPRFRVHFCRRHRVLSGAGVDFTYVGDSHNLHFLVAMINKTQLLLALIILCLVDAVVPLFPVLGLILIYVVLAKPPWFLETVRRVYDST